MKPKRKLRPRRPHPMLEMARRYGYVESSRGQLVPYDSEWSPLSREDIAALKQAGWLPGRIGA